VNCQDEEEDKVSWQMQSQVQQLQEQHALQLQQMHEQHASQIGELSRSQQAAADRAASELQAARVEAQGLKAALTRAEEAAAGWEEELALKEREAANLQVRRR
jgi:hypothetical protein